MIKVTPENRVDIASVLAGLSHSEPRRVLGALTASPMVDTKATAGLVDEDAAAWMSEADEKPLDPMRAHYLDMAMSPNVVCAKMEGRDDCWIGFVGEEPATEAEWINLSRTGDLGCGGSGYALVKANGEEDVTHNLWSPQTVPYQYADMFDAQYIGYRPLEWPKEERAYWAPGFDPAQSLARVGA